jgi:hypothetical protein
VVRDIASYVDRGSAQGKVEQQTPGYENGSQHEGASRWQSLIAGFDIAATVAKAVRVLPVTLSKTARAAYPDAGL